MSDNTKHLDYINELLQHDPKVFDAVAAYFEFSYSSGLIISYSFN